MGNASSCLDGSSRRDAVTRRTQRSAKSPTAIEQAPAAPVRRIRPPSINPPRTTGSVRSPSGTVGTVSEGSSSSTRRIRRHPATFGSGRQDADPTQRSQVQILPPAHCPRYTLPPLPMKLQVRAGFVGHHAPRFLRSMSAGCLPTLPRERPRRAASRRSANAGDGPRRPDRVTSLSPTQRLSSAESRTGRPLGLEWPGADGVRGADRNRRRGGSRAVLR
jgi:hypothetical protein